MRVIVVLPVLTLAVAVNAEPVPRLTTDSPEYCHQLAVRLEHHPGHAQQPISRLGEEGVRLCGAGQWRSGIAKLRRALRAAQATQ
jgi:hypothetical protein